MKRRPQRGDGLPDAGYLRDEELARRTGALEEQADAQFSDTYRIDPAKLREDAEILRHHDQFSVEHQEPGFVYCWAREDKPGEQVSWKLAQDVRMPDGDFVALWEVVQGDMPEATKRKDARGYRKIGDTILLRARMDRHRQFQIAMHELNRRREHGTSQGLEELARQSKGYVKVFSEADVSASKTTLDRAMHQGMARNEFSKKLRDGTAHHI